MGEWRRSRLLWIPVVLAILVEALLVLVSIRFRLIPAALLLVTVTVCLLGIRSHATASRALVLSAVTAISLFSPFDISPLVTGDGPRVAPLHMGLGIVGTNGTINGGCVVTGLEPKYILVW